MSFPPEVTEEMRSVLEEFTYNILKQKPADLVKFSADYFNNLYIERTGLAPKTNYSNEALSTSPAEKEHQMTAYNNEPKSENGHASEEEEDDDIMDMPDIRNRFLTKPGRRQSVAAESLDPEKIDYSQIKVYEKSDEQKVRLNEAIKDIFIFRSLEKDQHSRLIDAMFERTVEKDETVIKQGNDGDNFYVIEKGVFDIIKDDHKVATYENRGSFGELALMYNCPRAATVIARSEGILWAMDRESFLKIVLRAAFNKRRMYEELLAACEILKPLSEYERTNLADALTSRDYADGEEVCHEGDSGDEMFFVERGEVSVLSKRGADGMEKELRRIEKDGYFGELALLTDGHRNATIKAVKDVRLAVLDRSSFERLLGPCFDLMKGQSKAYIEDIVERLGKEAISQYPSLVKLLGIEDLENKDNQPEDAATESQNV